MAETLTVTHNGTCQTVEIPIEDGAFRATGLRELGVVSYDPAFLNTASVRSAITYIDGDAGISLPRLSHRAARGAEHVPGGRVPPPLRRAADAGGARALVARDHGPHVRPREREAVHAGLPLRRAPMGMLVSVLGALSTFYPEASKIDDPQVRLEQAVRLIAKVPTIAAWSYRHSLGLPYV